MSYKITNLNGILFPVPCLFCCSELFMPIFTYTSPPFGETEFEFSSSGSYYREVWSCNLCSHFVSVHDMDIGGLYNNDYLSSNYQDQDGIFAAFHRIISLRTFSLIISVVSRES